MLALVLAAALATPAPAASATPRPLQFQAPAGWTKLDSAVTSGVDRKYQATTIGLWTHGSGDDAETFNILSTSSFALDSYDFAALDVKQLLANSDHEILSSKSLVLCGDATGELITYQYPRDGTLLIATQIIATDDTRGYLVTYAHRASRPDDRDGLDALHSFCPPSRSATALAQEDAPITAPAGWLKSSVGQRYAAARPGSGNAWTWIGVPAGTPRQQALIVLSSPTAIGDATDAEKMLSSLTSGAAGLGMTVSVLDKKPVSLCRATGVFVHMTGVLQSKPMDIEAVISPGAPTTYMAFYMRLQGEPEDPGAVKALLSLCPADREAIG